MISPAISAVQNVLPGQDLTRVTRPVQKIDTPSPEHFQAMENTHSEIRKVVEDLAKISNSLNKRLDFHVIHDTNQVIVRVINSETNEVIRQLPPEALLRLHARIQEAVGLLFDETI